MENIRPADVTSFPETTHASLRGLPSIQLPTPLTSFIGREREVAAVVALLQRDDVRLLTLSGPGGAGKTRLACAAATQSAPHFKDGIRFVSLAPLADEKLVAPVIARTLGVPETGEMNALDRLRAWMREKELLVVLDNCEHLPGAAPLVPALLTACPGVTVLATSRALLRVSGEHAFVVPPLPREEAISLFAERAAAVNPDLVATDDSDQVVSEICRRLDGLPLAIELTAALANVLSPRAMLAHIEEHRQLPEPGMRDQPARQQTINATVAWSHALLADQERACFRWFAVFAGSFSLTLAEAVVKRMAQSRIDVLATIASLVNQSLLRPAASSGPQPRFEMLETFREFGLHQLKLVGDEDRARRAQAAATLDLVHSLLPGGIEPAPDGNLAQLQDDVDNIRSALAWFEASGDTGSCLRLSRRLFVFWWVGGHLREGRNWIELSLQAADDADSMRREATCLLGLLQNTLGDDEATTRSLELALSLTPSGNDEWIEPLSLRVLSEVATRQGRYSDAERFARRSLTIFDRIDRTQVPETLRQLGIATYGLGEIVRAASICTEALRLARETNDTQFIEAALDSLTLIGLTGGDDAGAVTTLTEALAQAESLGDLTGLPSLIANAAVIAEHMGAFDRAARLLGAAAALRAAVGVASSLPGRSLYEASTTRAKASLGESAFAAAWMAGAELLAEQAVAEARSVLESPVSGAPGATNRRLERATGHGLTPRELEVLQYLIEGRSDREIADALFISPKTVGTHMTHILDKLGVPSRAAAVAYAHRHGLA